MTARTHFAGGLLAGVCYITLAHPNALIAAGCVGVAAIGGLAPDIDIQTSKMGKLVKPASFMISKFFGHRTLFHSPILWIVLWLLALKLFPGGTDYITAFFFGTISHLILDMLNRSGIPVFYPCSRKFHIARIKLRSFGENAIFIMLLIGFCLGSGAFIFGNVKQINNMPF